MSKFKEFYKKTLGKLNIKYLFGFAALIAVVWTTYDWVTTGYFTWIWFAVAIGVILFVWLMAWIFRNNP